MPVRETGSNIVRNRNPRKSEWSTLKLWLSLGFVGATISRCQQKCMLKVNAVSTGIRRRSAILLEARRSCLRPVSAHSIVRSTKRNSLRKLRLPLRLLSPRSRCLHFQHRSRVSERGSALDPPHNQVLRKSQSYFIVSVCAHLGPRAHFWQDFPLKTPDSPPSSPFEQDLFDYLDALKWPGALVPSPDGQ